MVLTGGCETDFIPTTKMNDINLGGTNLKSDRASMISNTKTNDINLLGTNQRSNRASIISNIHEHEVMVRQHDTGSTLITANIGAMPESWKTDRSSRI